jgi:uncharacterized membrane protein
MANEALRSLPSVERLLARPLASRLAEQLGRPHVRDLLRRILDEMRRELLEVSSQDSGARIKAGAAAVSPIHSDSGLLSSDALLEEIERRLEARGAMAARPSLRSAFPSRAAPS